MLLSSGFFINAMNPMEKKRFELTFDNILLDNYVNKITEKYIFFIPNIIENQIVPLYTINELILNKNILNIKISILNEINEIKSFIYLEDVTLLKVKKLIDFDYNKSDLIKIKVKYKYKKQIIFKNIQEIKTYQRKQKIKKINLI